MVLVSNLTVLIRVLHAVACVQHVVRVAGADAPLQAEPEAASTACKGNEAKQLS